MVVGFGGGGVAVVTGPRSQPFLNIRMGGAEKLFEINFGFGRLGLRLADWGLGSYSGTVWRVGGFLGFRGCGVGGSGWRGAKGILVPFLLRWRRVAGRLAILGLPDLFFKNTALVVCQSLPLFGFPRGMASLPRIAIFFFKSFGVWFILLCFCLLLAVGWPVTFGECIFSRLVDAGPWESIAAWGVFGLPLFGGGVCFLAWPAGSAGFFLGGGKEPFGFQNGFLLGSCFWQGFGLFDWGLAAIPFFIYFGLDFAAYPRGLLIVFGAPIPVL